MSFLETQINLLKECLSNGTVQVDSPLIQEQKETIIEAMARIIEFSGYFVNRSELGAYVDKRFADELGID